jgi:hypothetical protein
MRVMGSKTGVSEYSKFTENLEFVLSELSKNYKKMTLKSNFRNHEKLVPTWKPTRKPTQMFGMQGP